MSPAQKAKLIDALDLLAEAQRTNEAAHMATTALDRRPREALAQILGTVEDRLAEVKDLIDTLLPVEAQ